jgi:hypothetical protein
MQVKVHDIKLNQVTEVPKHFLYVFCLSNFFVSLCVRQTELGVEEV